MKTSLTICLAAAAFAVLAQAAGCATGAANTPAGIGGAGGDDTSSTSGSMPATGASVSSSGMSSSSSGVPTTCMTQADCASLDNACHTANCVNGMCLRAPANDGAPCDDGLYCTEEDTCMTGVCVGGPQKDCPGGDSCHVGACIEATKSCGVAVGNEGASCDDGNPCTYSGMCSNGTCSMGPPIDCTNFDGPCSVGVCDPLEGCQTKALNDGAVCDDMLFCTVNDACKSGVCSGQPMVCPPVSGCFVAACDEVDMICSSVPGNDGAMCDDMSICTTGTTCLNGACINGTPASEGAMCDDGSACTSMTICKAGVCGGGIGPTVYFADDFHDNSKGWTLDTEWQIGPAKVSDIDDLGGNDPATDHTATADNGLAGVVIGGNASTAVVHPPRYMTSPPFDTSAAVGSVFLGFYRSLDSDEPGYMTDYIDVWNGSAWKNVWTSEDFVTDGDWTFESYDVTAYKNAGMRVRIGFDAEMDGNDDLLSVCSWSVDDLLVASATCP